MNDPAQEREFDWKGRGDEVRSAVQGLMELGLDPVEVPRSTFVDLINMMNDMAHEIARYRTNLSIQEGVILDTTEVRDLSVPLSRHLEDTLAAATSAGFPVLAMRLTTLVEIVDQLKPQ